MKKSILGAILFLLSGLVVLTGCQQKQVNVTQGPSAGKVATIEKSRSINDRVLWVNFRGERIYGHLYTPKKKSRKLPVAIIAHGLGGNYQELGGYARQLASRGYMAYAFDFPGGTMNGKSTGVKQTQMSVRTEERDLVAVIKQITAQKAAQSHRVLLVGGSQGGVVSALAASDHPDLVKRLALMYPAFSITHDAQNRYASSHAIPQTTDILGFTVGRAYYQPLLRMDVTKAATRYPGPVLIVHGSADDIVPIKYVKQASRQFKHSQFHELKGAGHGFEGEDQRQALHLLNQFIQ
ncbi:alpha/beta hydrolase family protein [Levilactobacillus namurensis]|uniref:alpha/beta hydrolase family protein n=1 Tax=Levilactobacillus namurensis TaxID=380393 RepID=UPI0004ADDD5D|nr:alpha/beta fold hydrolase [Levilactobacillus namurensis]